MLFQLQNRVLLCYGIEWVPEVMFEILKVRILPKYSDRNIYTFIIIVYSKCLKRSEILLFLIFKACERHCSSFSGWLDFLRCFLVIWLQLLTWCNTEMLYFDKYIFLLNNRHSRHNSWSQDQGLLQLIE